MNRKTFFYAVLLCASGFVLTGCQSTNGEAASATETGKKVAKVAVKAAVRHSPVAAARLIK